jgi:ADP-ribosyl-[dinitrogen reductase] hydrolase
MAQTPDTSVAADRLTGTLLGTALGDALGLPCEGMSACSIARRFGRVDHFRLLGRTGFVSDDTEQAALVAQSLARHADDLDACVRDFRRSLLGWFCRLPWGVGRATIRSCVRIGLGLSSSGVMSAGNGAAMRAAIVGAFFHDRPQEREAFGRALAEVTHRDVRAVEGALYVAELTACCVGGPRGSPPVSRQREARLIVTDPQLGEAIDRAVALAGRGADTPEAALSCGTTGFVVQTLAFATYAFLRFGHDPLLALTEVVSAGGDTDSIGAILGGWLGALHGESGLPDDLIGRIHDGPFGPTHLRSLAGCLAGVQDDGDGRVPGYSKAAALLRNLALYPVVLGHGFRRLLPL